MKAIYNGVAVSMFIALLSASQLISQPGTGGGTPGGDPNNRQIIDGIAAIVGNKVILISEVTQRALLLSGQDPTVDPFNPEVNQEILNSLIIDKLLLVKAEEDSVVVSDDLLNTQVDVQIANLEQRAGGTSQLERAYNKSIDEIKSEARSVIRDQLKVQILRQRHFDDLKVTERDIENFYNEYRDSLPSVPEQIELAHIVLLEKPSENSKAQAFALAEAIIDSIKGGHDFADFARRYSIDPGSGSKGGELGFVRKGKFVKEFEDAAWKLELNEISDPVQSKYGVHIIQLLDVKGDEARSRHILLPLSSDASEQQILIDSLYTIRERALDGNDFGSLASQYSEDPTTKGLSGQLGKFPTESLPDTYNWIVDSLGQGEISTPRPVTLSPTEKGYHIVKLIQVIPEHQVDIERDRIQLERLARSWKENQKLVEWVAELREAIYWDIKYTFN